jgi:hypothetical protein
MGAEVPAIVVEGRVAGNVMGSGWERISGWEAGVRRILRGRRWFSRTEGITDGKKEKWVKGEKWWDMVIGSIGLERVFCKGRWGEGGVKKGRKGRGKRQ